MKSLKTNAVLNVIQNVCKIVFPLITIPYASRVLEAANYGRVSFGNSIVRYFILIAALGVATYSQREAPAFREDKERIARFSNQVFSINVYATILSYIILLILLTLSHKIGDYSALILLQSLSIILGTIGADWINVVYEDYFYITVRYIALQCISLLMLFVFVRTPEDYYVYAFINVIATAGGNVFNLFYIRRYVKLSLVPPKETIEHIKPIMKLFCVSITTVIYISSDITILGLFMEDADVGVYTMASNVYSVVKQVISAVIIVSIPRLAYYMGKNENDNYKNLAIKVLNSLISLLIPAICGLVFLSEDILQIMGGVEYLRGRESLVVLSYALVFAIMAGFYSNGYLLLAKKDNMYLLATTISAVLNIGLNFILIPRFGLVAAALTTLFAEISMTMFALSTALKQYRLLPDISVIISSVVGGILVAFICVAVKSFRLSAFANICMSVLISVPLYFFILKIMNNPFVDALWEIMKSFLQKRK